MHRSALDVQDRLGCEGCMGLHKVVRDALGFVECMWVH